MAMAVFLKGALIEKVPVAQSMQIRSDRGARARGCWPLGVTVNVCV